MRKFVRSMLAIGCAIAAGPAVLGAQQGGATITGRVVSEAGNPLPSTSVFIEGLGSGSLTREDGRYSFTIPAARVAGQQVTLTARLIGYKPASVQITLAAGTITHDFTLESNPLRLGEVVVTGAGTQSTREKIGTVINTVDSAAISRSNETNVVNAIAGKAPNVNITSQSGEPGASSYIRIRGIKSLTGNAQPLFVVDGVPIDNSTINTEGSSVAGTVAPNRASDINPHDIADIQILKGAAASAIYGARAADGVVLITTRSGQAGATRYSLHSSYSWDDVNHDIPLQRSFGQGDDPSTPAECDGPNCRLTSLSWGPELSPGTPTFDHFGEMFETGHTFDSQLSMSGGIDRTTFYLSAGRLDQNGTIVGPNNWYKKNTARLKASHRLFDRLTVGGNVSYVDANGTFTQMGSNTSGLLLGAMRTSPNFDNRQYLDATYGLHRSFRFPNPAPTSAPVGRGYDNPFFVVNEDANQGELNRVYGNVNADFEATDWLSLRYSLGGDYYTDSRLDGLAQTSSAFAGGEVFRNEINLYSIDHNLLATAQHTFSPAFAGTLTLGQNINVRRFRQVLNTGQTLIAPQPFSLQNTITAIPVETKSLVHSESYFAQATADLFDQLHLTAALRNDGFSTFGQSNPRAWYPKFSMAWIFTNALGNTEQKGILSYGKLRAAYGETGKPPQVYATQTTLVAGAANVFGTGFGDFINGTQAGLGGLASSTARGNADIRPEREKETEIGLDLGLFDQRADAGVTYYVSNSEDVILPVPVSPSTGALTQLENGARMRNKGWEATLNVRPYTSKNAAWEVGFQFGKNKTEVLSLLGADFVSNASQAAGTFAGTVGAATVGQGIGLRGNDFVRCGRGLTNIADNAGNNIADVDAACGNAPAGALYIDESGFPVLDPTDRVIADPNPDWTGSIRTSFRFKRWQFTALVDHKQGGDVWNGTRGALYNFGTHKDTDIRGKSFVFGKDYPFLEGPAAGPGAGTPVVIDAGWFTGNGSGFVGPASQFVEDGSYTKLREISVAYTFDQPWVSRSLGLSTIDLRVSGRNLHTWTDYRGIDPEANLGGAAVLIQGVDYFNNPQTRSIVVSIGLNK
ncbi:MAG TPA: SusC/RagA family TonB-linked outer membrane protein [Gemmatimonadaceae bacterium]|nr:SusC/RagA family TonB-linked outer membrane protein [Gemmatimonadaceae bacterium]